MGATSSAVGYSLVTGRARLGWTRLGSPGTFGMVAGIDPIGDISAAAPPARWAGCSRARPAGTVDVGTYGESLAHWARLSSTGMSAEFKQKRTSQGARPADYDENVGILKCLGAATPQLTRASILHGLRNSHSSVRHLRACSHFSERVGNTAFADRLVETSSSNDRCVEQICDFTVRGKTLVGRDAYNLIAKPVSTHSLASATKLGAFDDVRASERLLDEGERLTARCRP